LKDHAAAMPREMMPWELNPKEILQYLSSNNGSCSTGSTHGGNALNLSQLKFQQLAMAHNTGRAMSQRSNSFSANK